MDTHIFRVTKRHGWVPEEATHEKARQILGGLILPDRYYSFHIDLMRLGREIRIAGLPKCEIGPVKE